MESESALTRLAPRDASTLANAPTTYKQILPVELFFLSYLLSPLVIASFLSPTESYDIVEARDANIQIDMGVSPFLNWMRSDLLGVDTGLEELRTLYTKDHVTVVHNNILRDYLH